MRELVHSGAPRRGAPAAAGGTREAATPAGWTGLQAAVGNRGTQRMAARLRLGRPNAAHERDADRFSAAVSGRRRGTCHCEQEGKEGKAPCERCRHAERASSSPADTSRTLPTTAVAPAFAGSGRALAPELRAVLEAESGTDLGAVRVHTGPAAGRVAGNLGASAFTVGTDIAVAPGHERPDVLLHEVAHVVQQADMAAPIVQRQGGGGDTDALGPCEVVAEELSNGELLLQLNRARLYLTDHKWGEDETYDYANLLRRLDAERKYRQRQGHAWLAERGLIQVPSRLYRVTEAAVLNLSVEEVTAEAATGRSTPGVLVTPDQFRRFLADKGIPEFDPAQRAAETGEQSGGIALPIREWTDTVYVPASRADSFFAPQFGGGDPFGFPWGGGFGQQRQPDPLAQLFMPAGAEEWMHDPVPSVLPNFGFERMQVHGIETSSRYISQLRSSPSFYTAGGDERLFRPRPQAGPSDALTSVGAGSVQVIVVGDPGSFMADPFMGGAGEAGAMPFVGASTLATFGQPPFPLPYNTTGVMWQGSHVSDLAIVNGQLTARGFRAPFTVHAQSVGERMINRAGGSATATLNRGTTAGTGYHNDWIYPYFPEAVVVLPAEARSANPAALIETMSEAAPSMARKTYRFSNPPRDHPAFTKAFGEQPPDFCPPAAVNCINIPEAMPIRQQALGGRHWVSQLPDGTVISLADPAHASAARMEEWAGRGEHPVPDSFFEERGLRRVRIGRTMLGRAGLPVVLGAGTALAGDVWSDVNGGNPNYVADISLGAGAGGVELAAERYLAPRAVTALTSRGVSGGLAVTLGRGVTSGGVAVVLAPVVEGGSMYFSDEEYTSIDWAARLTRTTVSAGGGALAAGIGGGAAGTAFGPGVGTAVGFVVGIGGYLLTDWLFGESVEETVREGMGEYGCTNGIGPGR